jgi:hypothetical protein
VRGYIPERFTGDAAAYAQVELLLALAQISFVAPATFGVLDAGFGIGW